MSSVLEMAFHRTSGCAPERGCCLLSFHNDIHHFLVIWGHWGLVTNPMIATIIQGGILLTALQDPHQQEKTTSAIFPLRWQRWLKVLSSSPGLCGAPHQCMRACSSHCLWFSDRISPYFIGGDVPTSVTAKLMGNHWDSVALGEPGECGSGGHWSHSVSASSYSCCSLSVRSSNQAAPLT